MRISTKGRYGAAVMMCLAEKSGENQTVADISQKLNISKIYLEQVFALLKKAGLIQSVKGAQGGYYLNALPEKITAEEILLATEAGLFESTQDTAKGDAGYIADTLKKLLWDKLDESVSDMLKKVTLADLLAGSGKKDFMFYI
jgi:Rrf2 family protein